MHTRRTFFNRLAIGLACSQMLLGSLATATAAPNQFAINVDANGNALLGYDTVAYFTEGKAMPGIAAHSFTWKGARWLFANARHRDVFAADPETYAPRIGGFCAVGAVNGRMADVDPQMWLMIRGKLYLYLNANVREIALRDLEASATQAETNWERLMPVK